MLPEGKVSESCRQLQPHLTTRPLNLRKRILLNQVIKLRFAIRWQEENAARWIADSNSKDHSKARRLTYVGKTVSACSCVVSLKRSKA
jgi:hypothetical protein